MNFSVRTDIGPKEKQSTFTFVTNVNYTVQCISRCGCCVSVRGMRSTPSALLANYRQDAAKRQTAGIRFTHRPKIRFFAPQGRHVAPIQVKLCRTDGNLGPLGRAKFHINRRRGWECGPQNIKNFHFLVKSCGATPLTDF